MYLRGDVLRPGSGSAVFTAQAAPDGGWYFCCDGKHLTSGKTGTRFYWNEEPNAYSVWLVEQTGSDGFVQLVNQSAQYYGKKQAIEYYNGTFMVYSVSNSNYFQMRLYGVNDHIWNAGTQDPAPTCESVGTLHLTCVLCAATKTETLPATGDHVTALVNAREATAAEDGYTGDEVCTVCGQTIKQGEVIPATGEPAADEPTDAPADNHKGSFDFISKLLAWLTELFRMFTRWIQK